MEVFSEAEFSLELRIRLRVRVRRVQRQRAASAEEQTKKKFYYNKNRKSFTSHVSAEKNSCFNFVVFFDNYCDHFLHPFQVFSVF